MRQQYFRLGSEQQRAVKHTPIERLFAKTIARDEQTTTTVIPQRKGEHAVEMLNHLTAVFFVKMRQDFGVRGTAKRVAARFQIGAQLAVVVEFAVEDHGYTLIFVESRLLAGEQINDRQPAH